MEKTNILASLEKQIKEVDITISMLENKIEQFENVLANTLVNKINNELEYALYDKEEMNKKIDSLNETISLYKNNLEKFRKTKVELENKYVTIEKYAKEFNIDLSYEEMVQEKSELEKIAEEIVKIYEQSILDDIEIKNKKEELKELEDSLPTLKSLKKIKTQKKIKLINKEITSLTKKLDDEYVEIVELEIQKARLDVMRVEEIFESDYNLKGLINKTIFELRMFFIDENRKKQNKSELDVEEYKKCELYAKEKEGEILFSYVDSFLPEKSILRNLNSNLIEINISQISRELNNIRIEYLIKYSNFLKTKLDELANKIKECSEDEKVNLNKKIAYLTDGLMIINQNIACLNQRLIIVKDNE